jgi:hypothetical protein
VGERKQEEQRLRCDDVISFSEFVSQGNQDYMGKEMGFYCRKEVNDPTAMLASLGMRLP